MPKRVTRNWLSRVAGGLASGALALSLLVTGGSSAPGAGVRPVLAEEIDCYNDKDLYNMAECAAKRELDRKTGNAPNEAQGAPSGVPEPTGGGEQAGAQAPSRHEEVLRARDAPADPEPEPDEQRAVGQQQRQVVHAGGTDTQAASRHRCSCRSGAGIAGAEGVPLPRAASGRGGTPGRAPRLVGADRH